MQTLEYTVILELQCGVVCGSPQMVGAGGGLVTVPMVDTDFLT